MLQSGAKQQARLLTNQSPLLRSVGRKQLPVRSDMTLTAARFTFFVVARKGGFNAFQQRSKKRRPDPSRCCTFVAPVHVAYTSYSDEKHTLRYAVPCSPRACPADLHE